MILIHAWPDGSFTTQCGGRDMSVWAEHQQAAKHGCIATWMSPRTPDSVSFRETLEQMEERGLVSLPDDPVAGKLYKSIYCDIWPSASAWQLWASVCISDFGAWFEPVTGPTEKEVLIDRLERLIKTRGEASLGVLVNLVRPIPCQKVAETLCAMVSNKKLKMEVRTNPRNHKETSIFRLA